MTPTRYFYDCEFLEDGRTIELISIGIVTEAGREYYAVNADMPTDRIQQHQWLMANVVPHLPLTESGITRGAHGDHLFSLDLSDARVKPRRVIANEVRDFLLADGPPELWAWYGAYDHVTLCQLWGPMVRLPKGIPMWTNDLQQEAGRLGVTDLPGQESGAHDALADARHLVAISRHLAGCGVAA